MAQTSIIILNMSIKCILIVLDSSPTIIITVNYKLEYML